MEDSSSSGSDSDSSTTSSSSSNSELDIIQDPDDLNLNNVNLNNYMGELKTPGGFKYSISDLSEKVKAYQEDDGYEIPDRVIDASRLAPPLDHDLYLQQEMKKKLGKRFLYLDETLKILADNWEALSFSEDKITMAYKAFDSDQAGYLTYNQLRAACLFFYEDVVIMNS